MNGRRMLAIHDISCVGRCSLTVALPVISSTGIECSVLPTSVLSTQTDGFEGFTFRDLTCDMESVNRHWGTLDLGFDAFYTGFLGSKDQVDLVMKIIEDRSTEGATIYVDPVMGDSGKLYSVFDEDFPMEMRRLSEKADVLIPNLTELCFMLELEYVDGICDEGYIEMITEKAKTLGPKIIVITGARFPDGKVGCIYIDYSVGEKGTVMRDCIDGFYPGSGDVFSSALVGSLEKGVPLRTSVNIAVDFVVDSIKRTYDSGAEPRYGLDFEPGLLGFAKKVDAATKELSFRFITSDAGYATVAAMASEIWREAYKDMQSEEATEYMIEKFQSYQAIKKQCEKDGYVYCIMRLGDENAGFIAFQKQDRMFLSKLYIKACYRGLGIASKAISFLKEECRANGLKSIYLTVNKGNGRAIRAYEAIGFRKVMAQCKDIGDGFVMDDYIMQLDLE